MKKIIQKLRIFILKRKIEVQDISKHRLWGNYHADEKNPTDDIPKKYRI